MAAITWDNTGERFYETGVDHGVLYPVDETGSYSEGHAWNGLVSVTEAPSGAEATPQYADNIKYVNLVSAEEFGGTIEAFTYPAEFEACDGTASIGAASIGQQPRKTFGLSYRTRVGNDLSPENGYKIHLIYGALAAPTEKAYSTVNDSPEAITFSWEFTTTPVPVPGMKPTAIVTIDSRKATPTQMKAVEDLLYGTETEEAMLPLPEDLIELLKPANGGQG